MRRQRRAGFSAVTLLVLAALMAACGSSGAPAPSGGTGGAQPPAQGGSSATGKEPILIGDLVTLTTQNALTGKEEEIGRQMAVQDINAKGGVNGRPLKLVTEDVAFDNQTAINAFQKVVGSHPSAIIGPVWSNQLLALEPLIKQAQIPTLYAGSAGIVTQQGNPYMFRDLTDVTYSMPVLAKWFFGEVHASKPAIIYSNDAFGISLKDAVVAGLKQIDVTPVTIQTMDDGATDISSQLAAVRRAGADSLFAECVSATGALVVRTAYQQGMKLPMMVANPILSESVLNLVPAEAVKGVYVESNYALSQIADSKVQAWEQDFKKRYNTTPDWAEAVNYGAVELLAEVMRQYGTTPQQVTDGLHKIHYQGLFTSYQSDKEGNLWHTDDVIQFGDNKQQKLVKELTIDQ